MTYLTLWEKNLLYVLLKRYEEGNFNCGATEEEEIEVGCLKAGTDDTYLGLPCDQCKYRKRFLKLENKLTGYKP